jgi:hypothetical protein
MPYVQRNDIGEIIGRYANPQTGYAEEYLEEDHQDLFYESPAQTVVRLEAALDRHLDAVANSYRYESIRTMVTYATSDHPTFGVEGKAAVKFRDAVYAYGIQVIADVQAGNREIPTEEELIEELPLITSYFE